MLLLSNTSNISALSYQSENDIEFTFNPTLSLSVSGDLTIDELVPGSSNDSNIINVNVSTNNVSGYNLSATVGNNSHSNPSYNTTNLTHTNGTNTFTSLSTNDSLSSLTTDNTWGYSTSTDSGTTWSNYSGLPIYTSTGTTLANQYNPGAYSLNFKIAAKAGSTQVSGDYTNVINFIAVGNPEVKYYMHEFTNQLCSTLAADDDYTVYDIRDGSDYTVRYINGVCWMTQNLRITGTISAQYSNFTGPDVNISQGDLDASTGKYCNFEDCVYYVRMAHSSNNTETGTWYNYAAATAGTVTGGSNTAEATSDICPINWKLPTNENFSNMHLYFSAFSPVKGGIYLDGSQLLLNNGYWWSSTAYNGTNRYRLGYEGGSSLYTYYSSNGHGFYIRCIKFPN